MIVVLDASAVVAGLVDPHANGAWAGAIFNSGDHLVAPHLMPVEVANILRQALLNRELTNDKASIAHADLLKLPVVLYPYASFGDRVWELRHNVAPHDAWYVALAEALGASLATLDRKLTRASGPRCTFLVPDS